MEQHLVDKLDVSPSPAIAPPLRRASPSHVSVRQAPRPPATRRPGVGTAPATFGEVVQGREPSAQIDFLVTLPITLESRVTFWSLGRSQQLYVMPPGKTKSLKAARLFLERFGIRQGGLLQICSGVSEGKGMASSSADLVATLRALSGHFEQDLSLEDMCAILREIEPTDGVMFDESVAFFHRRVELGRVIGRLPTMCVLAIDEGGEIDTIAYNRSRFQFEPDELRRYGVLIDELVASIPAGDVRRIGAAATESTRLHQRRNPKRSLPALEALLVSTRAAGIVTCHSGTCIGLLFDAAAPESLDDISHAERRMTEAFGQKPIKLFTR